MSFLPTRPLSPPELLPYVKGNDSLPPSLSPLLSAHLVCLSDAIGEANKEIETIEALLKAKKAHRGLLEEDFAGHKRITAPIRIVPPEILGVIFAFALGTQPFGRKERTTFTRIEGVCSSWRNVANVTPNLCRGLILDIKSDFRRDSERISIKEQVEGAWGLGLVC